MKVECAFSGNISGTLLFGSREKTNKSSLAWGFNYSNTAFAGFGGSVVRDNVTIDTRNWEKTYSGIIK